MLQTLKEIRGILFFITGTFSIGFSILVFNSLSSLWRLKKSLKKAWTEEAHELFISCQFEKLIKSCNSRIRRYPHDYNAYWWQARAYLEKGDVNKSDELFAKAIEIEPAIEDEYVRPYKPSVKIQ